MPGKRQSPVSTFQTRRILPPEYAKLRSQQRGGNANEALGSTHEQPVNASSNSSTSSSSPFRFFSSIRERFFRSRYSSALPSPVRRTARVLRYLAPVVPIALFFSDHVFQVMWVRGPSMTPYLNEDYAEMHTRSDMVLVHMWPWGSSWPWRQERRLERGMVVTFRSPANPSHIAIKRVIALPGDKIITREPCPRPSQIVPFNHAWVEGDADNPRQSLDSNTYGPISMSLITGRVVAVLYPRMRLLKWWEWDRPESDGESGVDVKKENGHGGSRASVRERVIKQAVQVERPASD